MALCSWKQLLYNHRYIFPRARDHTCRSGVVQMGRQWHLCPHLPLGGRGAGHSGGPVYGQEGPCLQAGLQDDPLLQTPSHWWCLPEHCYTAGMCHCVCVCVCVCVCLYRAVPLTQIIADIFNMPLTQIIADIFNMGVYVLEETANSASLGGAYRAKHGI